MTQLILAYSSEMANLNIGSVRINSIISVQLYKYSFTKSFVRSVSLKDINRIESSQDSQNGNPVPEPVAELVDAGD